MLTLTIRETRFMKGCRSWAGGERHGRGSSIKERWLQLKTSGLQGGFNVSWRNSQSVICRFAGPSCVVEGAGHADTGPEKSSPQRPSRPTSYLLALPDPQSSNFLLRLSEGWIWGLHRPPLPGQEGLARSALLFRRPVGGIRADRYCGLWNVRLTRSD